MQIIAIICLVAVIIYQGVFIFMQKKDSLARERDLLNRVMTRNYETFVQAEVLNKQEEPMTYEEFEQRNIERGIPV